jgi:hypothetical protein
MYRRTDANQVTTTFIWTLFAAEATDIVLPTLPAELAEIIPSAKDTLTSAAFLLEADTITGYDAIRNDLKGAFTTYAEGRAPAQRVVIAGAVGATAQAVCAARAVSEGRQAQRSWEEAEGRASRSAAPEDSGGRDVAGAAWLRSGDQVAWLQALHAAQCGDCHTRR